MNSQSITKFLLTLFSSYPIHLNAESESNWGQGPIEMTDQYFFSTLHLSSRPMTTEVLDVGKTFLSLSGARTNITILKKEAYSVDVETHTGMLEWKIGVVRDFEFGFVVPLIWRGGGDHDSDINSFHEYLGMEDGTRRQFASDNYSIRGESNGSKFDFEQQGTEFGNAVLHSKYLYSAGDKVNPAIAFNVALSLPTAKDTYGHESVDFLSGVTVSKRWGSVIAYTGASLIYYSRPEINGVDFERIHPEAFAEFEYEWDKQFSIFIGLFGYAFGNVDIKQHPDKSIYIDTGVKYRLSEGIGVEFLFRENTISSSGSADVSAYAGISYEH